ncbi:NUDIX hydrolase [Aliirhizobium smilacinae]|uniref:NUDIX hydrolase n=1 Tax=Aliirhizobium smilacinae TaxID=1395944 RepID=A0A5C4XHG8_9HYPH|nr:NUDIX hydrolase [Rhizobium smilacinae]TNM62936.1 NUDIX hydrolase [Rhizobium smilacinae]
MKPVKKSPKSPSAQQRPKPRTLLQQLAQMPEKLFSGEFRQQYGALCFRRIADSDAIEILVITSRESGRWVIPKGWPMKKKEPHQAAEIEAWQEAGIRGRARKKPIGRYTYLKWLDNGDVAPCVVDVFQVEALEIGKNYKERGQREIAWLSPGEAAHRVREIELKSLIIDFKPKKK